MDSFNLILGSGIMGAFIGFFAYLYPKTANVLFLASLGVIGHKAISYLKSTGEIHDLSAGVGETLIVELGRKLGWVFEIFERMPVAVQKAIYVYVAAFFVARFIAWIARANTPEYKESRKKRRKRILKSYDMKNMAELRSKY